MLTVREVLGDLDVQVLAGEANLDVPVRWVHISELADPTPWLSGGELLLTTGLALDTAERQREFIATLADHGLAGVGLGTGFTHDTVPPALVEAARERGFPLFEVPYELPFIALTEQAFTRLVNEQYALLQRSIAAQERLQRIVLSERGLDAIVGALATLVGGTRARVRRPRRAAGGANVPPRARRRGRRRRSAPSCATAPAAATARASCPATRDLAPRGLALPVAAGDAPDRGGVPAAWLVAVKDSGGLAEIDRLILHQAVTVVALELLRRRVADSTERRLAGDVLSAVVSGELAGQELGRRLEPFGLGGRVSALVLDAGRAGRHRPDRGGAGRRAARRGRGRARRRHRSLRLRAAARLPGRRALRAGRARRRAHGRHAGRAPRRGRGPRGSPSAVPARPTTRPAARSRRASSARRRERRRAQRRPPARGGGGRRDYHDLGSFQLLLSLQDTDALRLFCESLLGPIEHGEGHYGGELMRSLEAFIECNGQWEAAARRLYCHRHTLRYRIRKVEELTGRDLGSARDRIEFWLALRGREIVRTPTPTD